MTAPAVADRPSVAPADLANVAVFAALIAAMSLLPAIHVGGLTPITLQTLGVMLAGLCLGPWRGAAAVGLYLAVGIAGLPGSGTSPRVRPQPSVRATRSGGPMTWTGTSRPAGSPETKAAGWWSPRTTRSRGRAPGRAAKAPRARRL